eukprot:g14801.t1
MLLAGQGVEQNMAWAAHWFEQAALQGHVDAQYNLGLMLESGDGVPEDAGWACGLIDLGDVQFQSCSLGAQVDGHSWSGL